MIHGGDAVELLPEVVDSIPEDVPVCIYNTVAVYEFPEESKKQLEEYVSSMFESSARDVYWIYGEELVDDPVTGEKGFKMEIRNSSGS